MARCFLPPAALLVLLVCPWATRADDAVFSGPQPGEKLVPFTAKGVFDELAGQEFDLIEQAGEGPVMIIFVHARTRPAFGLTNRMMQYAASKEGLTRGVIFLTDDATSTERWMHVVEKHFPKGVAYGISTDGIEGPGSYGLNRNVTLTVLIGKGGRVTENLALVQPSLQADGPRILKALVEVTGGGEVPSLAELGGGRDENTGPRLNMRGRQTDPQLASLLRALINKEASAEDVRKIASEVEEFVSEKEQARRQLGRIAGTIVNSGRLANYGTPAAQRQLSEWAKQFAADNDEPKRDGD